MRIALLLLLLGLASVVDARQHRIPNGIPASLLLAGVVLGAAATGWTGGLRAASGAIVGLCALLPFYVLRAMGAGDVKLMAGAGALLGSAGAALFASAATIIAGGVLGLAYVVARRRKFWGVAGQRSGGMVGGLLQAGADTFPYAFAILSGTVATLVAAPPWAAVPGVG